MASDAANVGLVIFLAAVVVLLDAWFMYCLSRISLSLPVPNQPFHAQQFVQFEPENTICSCIDKCIKVMYPSYFFKPTQAGGDADDIELRVNESPVGPRKNAADRYYVSNKIMKCNPQICVMKVMSAWQLLCGVLFMVLQIVFMVNALFQFLVACLRHVWLLIFGIFVVVCMWYVFVWLLTKSLNATLLLWHNVSNEFNTNIQWIWCIAHVALWVVYTVFYLVLEAASDSGDFDRGFWPTILFWMIVRGMIWISLYTLVVIAMDGCVLVGIMRRLNHQDEAAQISQSLLQAHVEPPKTSRSEPAAGAGEAKFVQLSTLTEEKGSGSDSNLQESGHLDQPSSASRSKSPSLFDYKLQDLSFLSVQYVFLGITTKNSAVVRRAKYVGFASFIIALICLFVVPPSVGADNSSALIFAACMLLIYYLLVAVIDKVDFNVLYCIWSGRYHSVSWKMLRRFWNESNVQNAHAGNTLTLAYEDLWCLFAKHEYQYWCGFKCQRLEGIREQCKCTRAKWFPVVWELCKVIMILALVCLISAPFMFYAAFVVAGQVNNSVPDHKIVDWSKANESSPYPLCESLNIHGVNTLDLTFMTAAIYSPGDLREQLNAWFAESSSAWTVVYTHDSDAKGAYTSTYSHISNAAANIDIVLVRGTATWNDTIQDLSLWSEIGFVQFISWVVPLTIMTSTDFLRNYVYYASLTEGWVEPSWKDRYYDAVYDYVRVNLSEALRDEQKTIVVLGHSLGGGVSQIVAAKLLSEDKENNNILSFGVASPGTKYSSKKFGFDVESLHETSISVLPERDLVSQIDVHGGETQVIKCQGAHAADCHSVVTHFCELSESCDSAFDNSKQTGRKAFIECACGTKNQAQQQWNNCY